jgi:two-component system phosphate regulon response regulator OmpR
MNDKNLQQQTKAHILIVDDDTRILKLLKQFFEQNNFLVSTAVSAQDAEILLNYFIFDLMILDIMLPNITGFDFARNIRNSDNKLPIIMLTALTTSDHRISGLEAGANDYLTKPFEPRELLLRVQNLIDVYNQHYKLDRIIRFGHYSYNPMTQILAKHERAIMLSHTEQQLLHILVVNAGKIFRREELSYIVGDIQQRSIDVQITRLRSKIETDPRLPRYLKTIRNIGYVFNT